MTEASPGPSSIRFGVFEADLRTEELRKSGRKLRLPNQSFRVLAMLLNRAGQLVTREELRAQLWPAGTFVEYDQGLNAAVNRLREALGDSAEEPRFIETLPKRGYRLIAPIEPIEPATAPPATPDHPADVPSEPADISSQPAIAAPTPASGGRMRVPRSVLLAVLGAVLVIAGAIVLITSRPPADRPLGREVVPFTSLPGQEIAPTFSRMAARLHSPGTARRVTTIDSISTSNRSALSVCCGSPNNLRNGSVQHGRRTAARSHSCD